MRTKSRTSGICRTGCTADAGNEGVKKTGILSWFRTIKDGVVTKEPIAGDEFYRAAMDYCVRDLCLWSSINLIANLVSKCEFRTFSNGREVHDREYYLWNVEPNANQSSTQFLHKLISQLYMRNEALVIEVDRIGNDGKRTPQLLVADSFQKKPYALYDDQFTGVTVEDYTFARTFLMSDVLYFKLSEKNMRVVTDGVFESYNRLLKYATIHFQRSRGSRGVLTIEGSNKNDPDFQSGLKDLLENKFRRFFTSDNAVVPLFKGYHYEDIGSKTYSNETTRDIRAMIDDISDFTARGLGIPPALVRGTVEGTKDALDNLLTYTIDPLMDMLQEEINRKRSGLEGMKSKTFLRIDTKTIKHIDLLGVATSIDKLIGSGTFCVNDIRKACGEEEIEEPWAYRHFMTKNYADLLEQAKAMDGDGNAGA